MCSIFKTPRTQLLVKSILLQLIYHISTWGVSASYEKGGGTQCEFAECVFLPPRLLFTCPLRTALTIRVGLQLQQLLLLLQNILLVLFMVCQLTRFLHLFNTNRPVARYGAGCRSMEVAAEARTPVHNISFLRMVSLVEEELILSLYIYRSIPCSVLSSWRIVNPWNAPRSSGRAAAIFIKVNEKCKMGKSEKCLQENTAQMAEQFPRDLCIFKIPAVKGWCVCVCVGHKVL